MRGGSGRSFSNAKHARSNFIPAVPGGRHKMPSRFTWPPRCIDNAR
jgi:hypothetical protein